MTTADRPTDGYKPSVADWRRQVGCTGLILIQAPSCTYSNAERLDGGQKAHPRRRRNLVRKRGQLLAHIQNTLHQYNLEPVGKRIAHPAKRHDPDAFHRLRSVPGIAKILALTIFYEIHDVRRFDRVQPFASYARLVKCAHESGGKKLGTGGGKQENVHIKWAFSEAAVLYLRRATHGKNLLARLERMHGKGKALSILAHKIARAVYDILARGTVFSHERFMHA